MKVAFLFVSRKISTLVLIALLLLFLSHPALAYFDPYWDLPKSGDGYKVFATGGPATLTAAMWGGDNAKTVYFGTSLGTATTITLNPTAYYGARIYSTPNLHSPQDIKQHPTANLGTFNAGDELKFWLLVDPPGAAEPFYLAMGWGDPANDLNQDNMHTWADAPKQYHTQARVGPGYWNSKEQWPGGPPTGDPSIIFLGWEDQPDGDARQDAPGSTYSKTHGVNVPQYDYWGYEDLTFALTNVQAGLTYVPPGPPPGPAPIPAPAGILLGMIGTTLVGWLRRRRTF